MGNDGIRLVIDKDASNKLLIEACGGVHRSIRRNEASGLAPLVALQDSPRSLAFLHGLYAFLIQFDGRRPLTSEEDARLARGIARQLKCRLTSATWAASESFWDMAMRRTARAHVSSGIALAAAWAGCSTTDNISST